MVFSVSAGCSKTLLHKGLALVLGIALVLMVFGVGS
jgi:hypothetical protein